jgi:hypothetical protein
MSNIASLADQYAQVKLIIEQNEEILKSLKAQIVATGRDVIVGEDFKVTVGLQERKTISVKKAEEVLAPEVIAQILTVSEFEVIRYKPIAH